MNDPWPNSNSPTAIARRIRDMYHENDWMTATENLLLGCGPVVVGAFVILALILAIIGLTLDFLTHVM